MSQPGIEWELLRKEYPAKLVEQVYGLFWRGGPFEISSAELSAETEYTEALATSLLERLSPPLEPQSVSFCPKCRFELLNEQGQETLCPECQHNLTETGVLQKRVYRFAAPRTRDVGWVLAVHGMNTRGEWQEEFNWRVATAYRRSVPVAIYKYGVVRPGALSRWFLGQLQNRLLRKIETLNGQTEATGFGGPPDVIAHSLGTWLIGHALLRNPSFKVGRLILTGSILRPDFDWQPLIANRQIEAVLNHYGTSDHWAGIAQFFIPDSGPSGRMGFKGEAPIVQVCAEGYSHSDYFTEPNLPRVFEDVWRPFLTRPISELAGLATHERVVWTPCIWPLRATLLPVLLLLTFALLCLGALVCIVLGAKQMVEALVR